MLLCCPGTRCSSMVNRLLFKHVSSPVQLTRQLLLSSAACSCAQNPAGTAATERRERKKPVTGSCIAALAAAHVPLQSLSLHHTIEAGELLLCGFLACAAWHVTCECHGHNGKAHQYDGIFADQTRLPCCIVGALPMESLCIWSSGHHAIGQQVKSHRCKPSAHDAELRVTFAAARCRVWRGGRDRPADTPHQLAPVIQLERRQYGATAGPQSHDQGMCATAAAAAGLQRSGGCSRRR